MNTISIPAPGVTPATALTIAGSDSGGGAGIQADLRTFVACGVHGMTAITAVTVQNSTGVSGFAEIPVDIVTAQIEAVASDMGVNAAKTGMLATAEIIAAVAQTCRKVRIGRFGAIPLVVDPVAASMHGDPLLRADALDAIRDLLLPIASLATPNLDEVRLLTGIDVRSRDEQHDAARAIQALGPQWTLIKSGHLTGDAECVDLLFDGNEFIELPGPRFDMPHTHGGGDTLAAAITSALANGSSMPAAVAFGKRYIERAVRTAYPLGAKIGPVSPFWRISTDEV